MLKSSLIQKKKCVLKMNVCGAKYASFKRKGHQEQCRIALLGSHSTAHLDIPLFT